jgi:hypothetical protein
MGIEFQIDDINKVDEAIRGAYVEAEAGKFNFDPDKYAEIKAAGLKKKTTELLGKVKEKDGELAKFGKFKSLTEALAEAEDDEIAQVLEHWNKRSENGKGNPDAAKQLEMKDKLHAKELKKKEDELGTTKTELQKAQSELREFRLWSPLRDVFVKSGGDPGDWEVARLELANQRRFDFDEDGKIVVMEDGSASTVTPEKFFKEVYSDQRPKFYKASGAGGSGAGKSDSGRTGVKTVRRFDQDALNSNIEAIAKGEITVVD